MSSLYRESHTNYPILQYRAQLSRLPSDVMWSRDEFTAYLILQSYLSGALPVENLALLEERYKRRVRQNFEVQ
jgi:hypothetical protein